ncbi:MAG TPA: hypothetical protein DCM28_13690 [Phycisphaerales bacterium]|nr:hypothetical protein [Phycisphaerales bacterium]HCD31246.1 hypothetical protein [Phycisphaerales bacterium]|tara:strand:- start:338 stop:1330 length:993 start_codon:yes stop_codon:yes gene_type:complete
MNVRIHTIVLILPLMMLLTESNTGAESVQKPSGIFASAGWRDRKALNSDIAKGILVRVPWKTIEPQPGKFDLSSIELQKNAITHAGKQWSLAVLAGVNSPSWLTQKPFDTKTIRIKARTRGKGYVPVDMPCYWDQTVQDRLKKLAQALAEKYNDDPTLVLVYVPQMTSNGIEGHFNANRPADLRQAGLTGEKYIAAAKSAAKSFAMAFTQKAIAIEVHEILDDASIPEKIINDLWNDPSLNHRVGAGMWWLSGKGQYQSNLLKVLQKYPGDIYGQVIGRSDQTHRFPNGDYTAIFKQAKQLGIRYIEVWEYELKQPHLFNAMKQFNHDTQ